MIDYVTLHNDRPSSNLSRATTPTVRRSLIRSTKYSTQSTSESETTQGELPLVMTSLLLSSNADGEQEQEKSTGDTTDKIPSASS